MKKKIITSLVTTGIAFALVLSPVFVSPAFAGDTWKSDNHHYKAKFKDHARVINVEPIYRTVRISAPEQQCWRKESHRPTEYRTGNHSTGGIILGGIIGGVIGHQAGQGRARGVATVAGSVIGAAIGHDLTHQPQTTVKYAKYEKHCNTIQRQHSERRLDGYRVTYRYRGEIFTTRMEEKPGHRIPVLVKITPLHH